MSRYPSVPIPSYPADQQPFATQMMDEADRAFGPNGSVFKYRSASGGPTGPFPTLIASKQIGLDFLSLVASFRHLSGLAVDAREVAILVVGARFQAAFELYAHGEVAVKKAGLSEEQVEVLKKGEMPEGLSEGGKVAFEITDYLMNKLGALPQGLFDKGVEAFGREGVLALTHYVGAYAYTCIVLNAADAPVPE